jgi:hypothetical protein
MKAIVDFFIVFAWIGFDSLSYQIERGLFLRKLTGTGEKKPPPNLPEGRRVKASPPTPLQRARGVE